MYVYYNSYTEAAWMGSVFRVRVYGVGFKV